MPPGTKYVRTIQRNWQMIEKKQVSGGVIFDQKVKPQKRIRRYYCSLRVKKYLRKKQVLIVV
jgi:hypothetical protein